MVKKKNKFKLWLLGKLVFIAFKMQIAVSKVIQINKPDLNSQFIIAMWHAHQCGLYGIYEIANRINILISPSNDGQIITNACKDMGYKVIRGSKGRQGATKSVFQMLDALKKGDVVAVMIDGPRGPKHIVQAGVVELAKLSGIPIIPMIWHSNEKNFLKFNSWDEFRFPVGFSTSINLFGEPIYVNSDITSEEFEEKRLYLQNKLEELYQDVQKNYTEYVKNAK